MPAFWPATRAARRLQPGYSQATADARRRALLPFVWDSLGGRGQFFGNRTRGSYQNASNRRYLSYPGL